MLSCMLCMYAKFPLFSFDYFLLCLSVSSEENQSVPNGSTWEAAE